MMFTYILFFVGFYILIKGANFLVKGASSVANRFHTSPFLIGLVIVGIGTSIPEFATFFISHLMGEDKIGLGTVIGSNTFNILFILGVSALFFPLSMKKEWVKRDLIWNMLAVAAVMVFALWFGPGAISRIEGILLLFLFTYWLYATIKKPDGLSEEERKMEAREITLFMSLGLILAGLLGTVLGGKWVVDGAMAMAQEFGITKNVIGLTIIGTGTSLPELVVSFVAAYRKQMSIAVGNIIGSNIFDFLMVIGFGALVKPVIFNSYFSFDIVITLISTIILYGSLFVGKKYVLKRWQGICFIALYIGYFIYLIIRGQQLG